MTTPPFAVVTEVAQLSTVTFGAAPMPLVVSQSLSASVDLLSQGGLELVSLVPSMVQVELQVRMCAVSDPAGDTACDYQDVSFETGVCLGGLGDGERCTAEDFVVCQGPFRDQMNPPCADTVCIFGSCRIARELESVAGRVSFSDLQIFVASGERIRPGGAHTSCVSTALLSLGDVPCSGSDEPHVYGNPGPGSASVPFFQDFRLHFKLVSEPSVNIFSSTFLVVTSGTIHHLHAAAVPDSMAAGAIVQGVIGELRDLYENLVYDDPKNVRVAVGDGPFTLVESSKCAGQVCESQLADSDTMFCRNADSSQQNLFSAFLAKTLDACRF
eukprot:2462804-Rhodomonas_salina.1